MAGVRGGWAVSAAPVLICVDAEGNGHRAHHWLLPSAPVPPEAEEVCCRCQARRRHTPMLDTLNEAAMWPGQRKRRQAEARP